MSLLFRLFSCMISRGPHCPRLTLRTRIDWLIVFYQINKVINPPLVGGVVNWCTNLYIDIHECCFLPLLFRPFWAALVWTLSLCSANPTNCPTRNRPPTDTHTHTHTHSTPLDLWPLNPATYNLFWPRACVLLCAETPACNWKQVTFLSSVFLWWFNVPSVWSVCLLLNRHGIEGTCLMVG